MIGKLLSDGYIRNQRILEAQLDGITHEQSLAQTPYNVNCLNWVLGHIVKGRDDLLELLGHDRLLSEQSAGRYRRESEPITAEGPGVLSLDVLREFLQRGQRDISAALESMTSDEFEQESEWFGGSSSLAEWAQFFYFHDTYHTGQTDLLRQLSGKRDKVI